MQIRSLRPLTAAALSFLAFGALSAHAAAGDQTGAGRSRPKQHAATIVFAHDFMGNRVALELHGDEVLVRVGGALLDRIGHFVGLAVADADLALAVANNGERGEGKATTTLHDLGATIDEDDLLQHAGHAGFVATLLATTAITTMAATGTLAAAAIRAGRRRRRGRGSRGGFGNGGSGFCAHGSD